MAKVEYPKWLFHKTEPMALVQDEAEHKALGNGWYEEPVAGEEASVKVYDIATDATSEIAVPVASAEALADAGVVKRRGRPPKAKD